MEDLEILRGLFEVKTAAAVRKTIGFALDQAERRGKHLDAKPLQGFGGAGVVKVVEDHMGDIYRGVCTGKFAG